MTMELSIITFVAQEDIMLQNSASYNDILKDLAETMEEAYKWCQKHVSDGMFQKLFKRREFEHRCNEFVRRLNELLELLTFDVQNSVANQLSQYYKIKMQQRQQELQQQQPSSQYTKLPDPPSQAQGNEDWRTNRTQSLQQPVTKPLPQPQNTSADSTTYSHPATTQPSSIYRHNSSPELLSPPSLQPPLSYSQPILQQQSYSQPTVQESYTQHAYTQPQSTQYAQPQSTQQTYVSPQSTQYAQYAQPQSTQQTYASLQSTQYIQQSYQPQYSYQQQVQQPQESITYAQLMQMPQYAQTYQQNSYTTNAYGYSTSYGT